MTKPKEDLLEAILKDPGNAETILSRLPAKEVVGLALTSEEAFHSIISPLVKKACRRVSGESEQDSLPSASRYSPGLTTDPIFKSLPLVKNTLTHLES